MKMNRAVIQVTLEYPANVDPVAFVKTTGGQLFKCTEKKLIEETPIGDVYPPSVQKKDEFLIVRKIINDSLKRVLPKLAVRVYGSRNGAEFAYWAGIALKLKDWRKVPRRKHLFVLAEKCRGYHFTVSKGTLFIKRGVEEWNGGSSVKAQLSLGDPDISDKIVAFFKKIIE